MVESEDLFPTGHSDGSSDTCALRPPPGMGEVLARRLPDVASYTLRNGHLFLALKMDGGIFEFARE